ncbi:MAG: lytic transglycosylase domain-containing protein, partial [Gammaproteobacteria bacterium]
MLDYQDLQPHQIPPIPTVPVTHECIVSTAERFDLPILLLHTILKVEGGEVGEVSFNKNNTYDIGPMQINSIWLEKFTPYVSPSQILYNGCINLQIGAWILRSNINKAKGDFWKGVGNYHSGTPHLHRKYQ